MDTETLLAIHKAIASPTHMQRYEAAKLILNNGGKVPLLTHQSRKRTFYRIQEKLRNAGII
ncbi:MAG: hypothetical protein MJY99_10295 [Fibrobacter sp.]|nr:hypothetical protein [Fibrobacter sp.]